mgnify:CR=1 FL=1
MFIFTSIYHMLANVKVQVHDEEDKSSSYFTIGVTAQVAQYKSLKIQEIPVKRMVYGQFCTSWHWILSRNLSFSLKNDVFFRDVNTI